MSVAQERGNDKAASREVNRREAARGNSDRSDAQLAFRMKLGELVRAGQVTREEAGQLFQAAFPDNARGGASAPARSKQRAKRPDYGYSGKNKIADPAEHIKSQAKPVYSGPQPGEKLLSFKAVGLRGELEGKEFDPIAHAGDKPHILLFTKGATGGRIVPLLGHQLGAIMKASGRDMHMSVVHLSDDPTEVTKYMGKLKGRIADFVDVGFSKDGGDGPGNYGLDRNLTHTFILAKDGMVVHNLTYPQQVFYNVPHILGAISSLMGVEHETLGKWLDNGAVGRGDARAQTRQRAPAREQIVKRFDKDGDGKLSQEEGQAARRALGQ